MKNSFVKSIIFCILAVILDFVSKQIFIIPDFTPINRGLFLGFFQESSQGLKVIFLSCISGFLFTIYLFLIYFISEQFFLLKYGMSLFIGGIWGNVIDQMVHGYAYDFIPINIGLQFHTNTADLFQWTGFIIVIFTLIHKKHDIWSIQSIRKTIIVNKPEQLKFSFKMTCVSLCTCLLLGLFAYSYFKAYFPEVPNKKDTLAIFLWSYIFLCATFNFLVFILALYLSHRTAGPLYAFEKYVQDLLRGEDYVLNLRDGDNYRHFEQIALKLKQKIEKS